MISSFLSSRRYKSFFTNCRFWCISTVGCLPCTIEIVSSEESSGLHQSRVSARSAKVLNTSRVEIEFAVVTIFSVSEANDITNSLKTCFSLNNAFSLAFSISVSNACSSSVI